MIHPVISLPEFTYLHTSSRRLTVMATMSATSCRFVITATA
jgi:hypothetical protein